MSSNRLNQNAEIWLSTAPLCGMGSGRITSKAEMRSVATKRSVWPRSKTSRTFPLRSFFIPGRSIEDCVGACISERRTSNAERRTSNKFLHSILDVGRWAFDVFCVSMAGIVVKPRARILHGHDWVFSSEVLKVFGNPTDGDVISLKDGKDHLIGSALYNSKSQIVARRFSRRKQDLDLDFFKRRIAQAAEYRARRGVDPQLCRVVWSESDGLPGVVIDRYGEHFVLQTLTLAMDMRRQLIAHAVIELFGAKNNIERNDAPIRRAEGLELRSGVLEGPAPPGPILIEINGTPRRTSLQLEVDLLHGQKTGFYLDQRENYEIVAQNAQGRRVLDCFTNQAAFALACAHAGANAVTGVEANSESIGVAQKNARRNHLQVELKEQDVFQFLREAGKAEAQYDLIVLDPPSFTKTKGGSRTIRSY